MMVCEWRNIAILNTKGVDYRCVLWNISKNDPINMLDNSKLDNKDTVWIWILAQIKHSFKWLKKVNLEEHILETLFLVLRPWKKFDELKDIDLKHYCSNYDDVIVNKYGVKCGIPLRFWENKGWINSVDPYGCFQWYLKIIPLFSNSGILGVLGSILSGILRYFKDFKCV